MPSVDKDAEQPELSFPVDRNTNYTTLENCLASYGKAGHRYTL